MAVILADDPVDETRNIAPGVEADFDANGRLLALELLRASEKYDVGSSVLETSNQCLSLAQAGELIGLSPTTLRHQIERGALSATKIGRNWQVHIDDLNFYMKHHSRKVKTNRSDSGE